MYRVSLPLTVIVATGRAFTSGILYELVVDIHRFWHAILRSMSNAAFFDLDYTLYNGYTASDLLRFLTEHDYVDASLTEEMTELERKFVDGSISYKEAVAGALRLNVTAIKGKSESEVDTWIREFIAEYDRIYPWVRELMSILRSRGYSITIISASMDFVVKGMAKVLGVDQWFGSTSVIKNGVYSGGISHILNFDAKHNLVQTLLAETPHETHVAFGDSEGDIYMLSAVDKAVVYNPKSQNLVALATERKWFIANEENILDYVRANL
jgi:HAD superfamily hydrolase (TIGR01490 family)